MGRLARPYDPQTDNPLVIDSVSAPGTRHTGDFQETPSGKDAVFTSTLALTGYDTGLIHREVFRFDESSGVECPSCNSTEEEASGRGFPAVYRARDFQTMAGSSSIPRKDWSTVT